MYNFENFYIDLGKNDVKKIKKAFVSWATIILKKIIKSEYEENPVEYFNCIFDNKEEDINFIYTDTNSPAEIDFNDSYSFKYYVEKFNCIAYNLGTSYSYHLDIKEILNDLNYDKKINAFLLKRDNDLGKHFVEEIPIDPEKIENGLFYPVSLSAFQSLMLSYIISKFSDIDMLDHRPTFLIKDNYFVDNIVKNYFDIIFTRGKEVDLDFEVNKVESVKDYIDALNDKVKLQFKVKNLEKEKKIYNKVKDNIVDSMYEKGIRSLENMKLWKEENKNIIKKIKDDNSGKSRFIVDLFNNKDKLSEYKTLYEKYKNEEYKKLIESDTYRKFKNNHNFKESNKGKAFKKILDTAEKRLKSLENITESTELNINELKEKFLNKLRKDKKELEGMNRNFKNKNIYFKRYKDRLLNKEKIEFNEIQIYDKKQDFEEHKNKARTKFRDRKKELQKEIKDKLKLKEDNITQIKKKAFETLSNLKERIESKGAKLKKEIKDLEDQIKQEKEELKKAKEVINNIKLYDESTYPPENSPYKITREIKDRWENSFESMLEERLLGYIEKEVTGINLNYYYKVKLENVYKNASKLKSKYKKMQLKSLNNKEKINFLYDKYIKYKYDKKIKKYVKENNINNNKEIPMDVANTILYEIKSDIEQEDFIDILYFAETELKDKTFDYDFRMPESYHNSKKGKLPIAAYKSLQIDRNNYLHDLIVKAINIEGDTYSNLIRALGNNLDADLFIKILLDSYKKIKNNKVFSNKYSLPFVYEKGDIYGFMSPNKLTVSEYIENYYALDLNKNKNENLFYEMSNFDDVFELIHSLILDAPVSTFYSSFLEYYITYIIKDDDIFNVMHNNKKKIQEDTKKYNKNFSNVSVGIINFNKDIK